MLKVLLVDDEPFIVQGLSALIDWEKEGFEIVGTAGNWAARAILLSSPVRTAGTTLFTTVIIP